MQWIPASQRKPKVPERSLWLGLLLLLSSPAMADPPCEKTLRWNDDPPLSMELPDGSVGGIYVELNDAAMERLGCKTRLRKLPWARALKEVTKGTYGGAIAATPKVFKCPKEPDIFICV